MLDGMKSVTTSACVGVPVCPHAGGVGLCEMVQHLQTFYLMAVSDDPEGKITEWVDHLHEPFVDPAVVIKARLPAYELVFTSGFIGTKV